MELMLAKKCDAEKVYALVQETIRVVYPKYYLKEIVDMFCEFHSRENIIKDIEAGNTYILVENEEIIGTGTKNGNHEKRLINESLEHLIISILNLMLLVRSRIIFIP